MKDQKEPGMQRAKVKIFPRGKVEAEDTENYEALSHKNARSV